LACGELAAMIRMPSFAHMRPNCVTAGSPRSRSCAFDGRTYTFFQSVYNAPGTFFKSAFAFAVFSAISASLLAFLTGMVGFGTYWALGRFSMVPAISHFKPWILILLVLAVFAVSVPVEFVYARRKLFSGIQQPNLKPTLLFFPSAVGVAVCSQVFHWLRMLKKARPRMRNVG
jgi:hypothetical protein